MNDFAPYQEEELKVLLNEPWEISDDPFKLHAAYALSCLYEAVIPDPDEDEELPEHDAIFGMTIPQKFLDRVVADAMENFNAAATNYGKIDVWGKSYAIRKRNAYDHTRINQIFKFPLKNGEYQIVKEGVIDLKGCAASRSKYEDSIDELKLNKTYLRQIIMLAEDDDNDGYDKLTDMEISVYCWAQYYNKSQSDNFMEFLAKYKDYLYVSEGEMKACWNYHSELRGKPRGMYCFSATKVKQWNQNEGQKSIAETISPEEADNYWYETALKTTFKPIDG